MVDWTKPICTKHETPHIGEYLGPCTVDASIHRVGIYPPSLAKTGQANPIRYAVYRYDAKGRARQGAGPSDADLVNYNENDGAVRLTREGQKVVCSTAKAA